MEKLFSVIPVKLVHEFTRRRASTRKRKGGERECIFLVIPTIVYRESILALFRMDPRGLRAGMVKDK
jgi:hypothetical protein